MNPTQGYPAWPAGPSRPGYPEWAGRAVPDAPHPPPVPPARTSRTVVATALAVTVLALLVVAGVGGYALGRAQSSAPAAPVLVSPAEGASFDFFPRTTEVHWDPVSGARTYLVEVQYNDVGTPNFYPAPGKDGTVDATRTSYTFSFIGAQPGRWRVTAVGRDGVGGPPSAWRTFVYQR